MVAAYGRREVASTERFLVYQYGLENLLLVENLRKAQGLPVENEQIKALDAALLIHGKHEIVVNGGILMAELGLQPGPNLGHILNEIETAIVDGDLINEKEAIFDFLREKGMI